MFRPELRVLDCSIRDGGLINKWMFTDELVRDTYRSLSQAGVDYIEIGYKASKALFNVADYGKWRFCADEDVKRVLGDVESSSKLACMVDIGRVEDADILPMKDSIFDMIRAACYVKDVEKGIDLCNRIMDKGYETTLNIMAVSTNLERELNEGLFEVSKSAVPCVYVVDSYGNMYSEDIDFLMAKYKQLMPGKTLGIHTHNNRQLAFANAIQAIIDGANMVDASVFGIGRGPGNCTLELLLTFLKNPKYSVRPVLELIQKHYLPLSREIEWGYIIPYMIQGVMNEHPRVAIEYRSTKDRDDFVGFWDKLTTPEVLANPAE